MCDKILLKCLFVFLYLLADKDYVWIFWNIPRKCFCEFYLCYRNFRTPLLQHKSVLQMRPAILNFGYQLREIEWVWGILTNNWISMLRRRLTVYLVGLNFLVTLSLGSSKLDSCLNKSKKSFKCILSKFFKVGHSRYVFFSKTNKIFDSNKA
jgi:hypothetical protein